ncbi:MAG: PD-(D/E)XK nuclease family protein [Muribaculaceae bacterium]|nr:PD-(D/E)XK nuclease family protein [Muribaculaceae bacterium]MDE6682975.1 PD-(D/E)XK nuclease family protein [Muribaculaceae bacterium]
METYEKLKQSPVFQMSLHSKELFHSNFLAWLGEDPKLREVFRNVMVAIGLSREYVDSWGEDFEILREKNHFDLIVKAPVHKNKKGKERPKRGELYLVIENKIKSVPTGDQLNDYSKKLESYVKNPGFTKILLSMGKYDGILPDDWKQATYEEVIEGLKKPVSGTISPYKSELIKDYTSMLETLVKIMGGVTVSTDDTFLPDKKADELREELDKLRIADLYDKWRASKIAALVSKELGVTCYSGYTNKTPFIEVHEILRVGKEDKDTWTGTIQIQGAQYRRCIWGPFESKELAKSYPGFLYPTKDEFKDKLMEEYPNVFEGTRMRRDYCCYGENDERPFWYQYVVIGPETKISTIIECIRQDLESLMSFQKDDSHKTSL